MIHSQLSTCEQPQPLPSVLSSHPPSYSSARSLTPSQPSPPPQSQHPVPMAFNPPAYTEHPGPTTLLPSSSSPADFFLLLFDDIIQLITNETNCYAAQNPPGDRYKWLEKRHPSLYGVQNK